jgi:DNA repair exonuclease SbcCD ATPase subunit
MLVFLLTLRAAATAGRIEGGVSPVDKVLELMQALYAQVKEQGKAEAEAYKEFACFCKDTQLDKDKEINDGDDTENDQYATIEQKTAEKQSLGNSIEELHTDLDDADKSIDQAAIDRENEKKEFETKHADVVASVEGVRTAIATITEATSFVEREAVIKSEKVQALLKKAAEQDPGDKSRVHAGLGASASITDVLDMLLDDWTMKAKKMEDEEAARKTLYDQTSANLRTLIIDTQTAIENSRDQLSNTESFLAKTKAQLTETKANLNDDNLYLKDLTAQCELKAKEWDQRSVMRANEMKALEEAIDIVGGSVKDTQGTRGYTDNTEPALLQGAKDAEASDVYTDVVFTQLKEVRKTNDASRNKQARLDAVTKLKRAATKLQSVDINLLAMKIAANPFAKVKELIQQLITRLLTESQNEATQKGWCDTEIGKANTDRDHRMEDTKSLSAKALVLEAEKKNQEQLIKTLSDEISTLQSDHAEVTKIREAEKAENKKVLEDSREGLAALEKAMATLKKFYGKASRNNQSGYVSLVQTDAEQSPVASDMASAGVSGAQGNYEGNQAAGQGIIGIMEVIQSDFKRSIEMAETSEKESYEQYASFDKEAKASLSEKERGLENAKDDLKIASGDLVATLNKLKDNQKLLDMSLQALETLRPACVDTGMSWEEKVKRRDAEIAALKDALAVFEDPNGLGFLQKH